MTESDLPFWEAIPLKAMARAQWESLCDGCAKCCLNKFEDEDTGEIHYSNVACFLLDHQSGRCQDYPNRSTRVPDCVTLTLETLESPGWLPQSCAYRRLAEGQPLPSWHPLITGDADSVINSGNSVLGRIVCETQSDDPLLHLIDWVR
ncbi:MULTISPECIES: YcgN family cysteine cluster protein [Thiorhodovibrio]|uniref:YcgN family cysteine cluster protein n=1 Tax=Thiorhodovibrio TaxID=61593 RepID=UPI001913A881|nr:MULTISPECIES: YcgN family cysteine cluster protein [Thiorhodovibrio]MBK5968842.1 hypothetical protein [Thiorhodovibrio winogradskyi]WPL12612.1 hypothetical protein Thiosp_02386 [Thiorhodovibrio litoralis]